MVQHFLTPPPPHTHTHTTHTHNTHTHTHTHTTLDVLCLPNVNITGTVATQITEMASLTSVWVTQDRVLSDLPLATPSPLYPWQPPLYPWQPPLYPWQPPLYPWQPPLYPWQPPLYPWQPPPLYIPGKN